MARDHSVLVGAWDFRLPDTSRPLAEAAKAQLSELDVLQHRKRQWSDVSREKRTCQLDSNIRS